MKIRRLEFALLVCFAAPGMGCHKGDECTADCGAASDSAADTSTSMATDDQPDESTTPQTGADLSCSEATELATQFLEENRACETILDCVSVSALCYANMTCGAVALSATAEAEWDAIASQLGSCECGADPCGAQLLCSDAGECAVELFSEDACPSYERDIETFIGANRRCSTTEDCIGVDAGCYAGPQSTCAIVALSATANLDDWARLSSLWNSCVMSTEACVAEECDAHVECSPTGECIGVL